ncbi:beta-hydroxyacid dehydrogenase [Moniliophthora roreri MCA 2997]|uniref:Beta-hydroxyacid dehydrogenase n=1 Tax=Moniliophthora roreri (strain MCA 2997) TaxID=1381753 RepID=V2XJP1_MONRO|nr:beta-hydroxyacid dehydrogenase [Moniliophthora roreri MCA 2997]
MTPNIPYPRPTSFGPKELAFVGIGTQRYFIARNLATRRLEATTGSLLLIWNRTREKTERLAQELGVSPVAVESDMILSCMANDNVVESTYEVYAKALLQNLPQRRKFLLNTVRDLNQLDKAFLANLVLEMSGDYRSKQGVAHLWCLQLEETVIDLGEDLENGNISSLYHQPRIHETLGEAFALADKAGISGNQVHNLVREIFPVPSTITYAERMACNKFDGSSGFNINGVKDATHFDACYRCCMPAADLYSSNPCRLATGEKLGL